MTDINFDNVDFSKFEDDKNSQIDPKTGIDLSRFQDDPEAPARKEAFIRAQLKAQNVTPDKAVSAKNDGKTLGVDYESALNNPEIIKQRKILESQYYDELAKKYPTTALFMTDPQNYAIAQGDEENLGIFERSVKALDELGSAFGAGWRGMAAQDEGKIYFDKHILGKDLTKYDIKSHSRAGVNPTITGEQRLAQSIKDTQLYGQETKYYAKQGVAPDMMRATGYGFANLGYMAKNAVTGLFEDIGQLGSDIYENPTVAPMLVGAAATAIASKGKIDPTKALKAKDVGAKLLGADLAAFVVTDSFKQNTNEAHQLYTGVRDEEGNPMPANIAKTAAIMSGSLNASLDALQMGMITKTFSPVVQAALRKLGKKGMNEAIAEALKRKTGRDIVKKYITTAGKIVLAEGAVEGTQSIIKDTIRLIAEGNAEKQGNAKFVSPTLFEGTDKEDSILSRAGSDAIEAIKSTAAIGFLGASHKAFSESRLQNDIAKFEEDKAKLDAVNDAVNGTETIVRDPETISRLARSFGGDADTKQLYMDAEKTRDLFQGMDASRDPVDIVNELFGQETANRFSEALSTSTTFAVPFDAYVVKVMGTGLYEQAKEFTQLNAYSLSAEDIANFESLQQQHLDDLKRTADNIENAPSAVKQVYDDVYGQIESLNLPFLNKTDRSMFAALWAKKMATASIRKYQTPDKAYEMYDAPYKTKFVNEVSKLNDLARTRFDSTVDPLIDSLRTGTMPSDSEIYGDTLMEGLRKLGISDDRGDLKSMDVDKDLKPFTRKLLRDDGMTLDDAAQWAVDNGYIQEADINALIAAIDSDLRGNPVYNMNNPNEERLGRKQKLEELQNYFDKQGINISEFSNDELKALLRGQETISQSESGGRESAGSGQEDTGNVGNTKAPTPMSERANGHKAHIETDDGKHIYEGTTGDSSFHYLWNEDNDEVSLYRVKLLKNKDTGVVENHAISIVDPSTGKVIGHLTTGNKNLTDPTLIMSSTGLGSAVQHYAQDPATLTQSERDANVKELTNKAIARSIKSQEQKIAMGEEMGVSKAKREKEQAELDRLKGLLSGDNTLYQQEQALKLMITHNLTEGNLLHALKMGGIPVPSLAIVNANTPLDSFGEITLLGSKEMADPKGYAKTKVFGADIYSPRYPSITHKVTQSAVDKLHQKLKTSNDLVDGRLPDKSEIESYGVKELADNAAVKALFLNEKGVKFDIATKEVAPIPDFLMPFTDTQLQAYELRENEDFKKAVISNHEDAINAMIEGLTDSKEIETIKKDFALTDSEMTRVIRSNAFKVTSYREQIKQKGEVDNYKTKNNINKAIEDNSLESELNQFAQDLLSSMNPEEKIHKGNQKFIPHTIENVIKILKTDLRGGEGFNYRIGSLRAKFTPEFKSLKQIKEEGGRLLDADAFAKVKDEVENEFQLVRSAISRNGKTVSEDTAFGILEDIPSMGMSKVIKDYNVDITEEGMQSIAEFLTRLKAMPTEYFEAKILRSVDVSEFSGAVIPANATQQTRDTLTKNGIQFREYEKGERAKVLREFAYELNEQGKNTLFQQEQIKSAIGNTGEFSKDNPNILYQSEKVSLDNSEEMKVIADYLSQSPAEMLANRDLYARKVEAINSLVSKYEQKEDFNGAYYPTAFGFMSISPSAKSEGKWQLTSFDAKMNPLSDQGDMTKNKALTEFFKAAKPNKYGADSVTYFQQSNSIPIYRIDAQGFDKNIIKPHGLYVSIPSDVSTFDSPHKDVGDTSFSGYATPKNPLNVDSVKIQHKRGNNYPIETSAGVSALKQLVDAKLFDSLIKADKAELTATVKEQFPDIDTSQYHDAYELLEVLGAQLAKQEGYDAIIQKVEGDPMNEMVILDNSIIGDLNSNNLNQGFQGKLTIQSNREMLVTLSGKADFSTLLHESAHLWLEMMLDDLKSADVTQQSQNDWAVISNYFASYSDKAKAEIVADHASLERDVKKLEGMKKRSPERDLELRQKTAMIEAHKKAIAMIEANPDLLKEVAKDFGQSISDNDVKNILTKPYHEQFARSMEAYFREGKAPSTDLLEAFSRFKYWLQDILYPFLKMLGVELTDDVRGVFDRMIATDAEIESIQQIQQAQRNFDAKMLKELGLTDEQIETYEKLAVAATTDAEDKLRAADMRDQLKKKTDEYKAELDDIKQEVADELSKQPAQILLHFLRTGEFKEGTESLFPIEPTRLDTQSIIDSYGKQQLQKLPRGVYGRDGKHPDIVANAFGISSGSKLMDMLINEPLNTVAKQNTYIKEEAARRMNERNPDLVSIDKLSSEAQKAIHGDKRAELLIAEMNALSKKTNKPFTPAAMLYDLAMRQFDNMHIEDINALKYLTAERKINRDIRKQIAQGDFDAALVGVQKALFNQYMYNQAVKVEEQIKDGIEAAKRYDKKAVREKIAKGGAQEYIVLQDGDKVASFSTKAEAMDYSALNEGTYVTTQNSYLEMIDSIRGAYSFKKVPKWLITQQDLFAKLYRAALDEGLALPFDPAQFAKPKNYTKLTLREFNDVIGALKVIEKVSNLSQGMETQYGKLDMNEVLSLMEQTVSGLKSRKVKFEHNKHFVDTALEGIDSFAAFQTTINAYVHALDGAETAGIFHDVLILPQREAFIKENKMLLVKDDRVDTIFKPVYAEVDKKDVLGNARLGQSLDKLSTGDLDKILLGNRVHLPSLNTDLSIQDIMGMAWLMGHKGGREALTHPEMAYNVTSGGLWTEENILKALEVLTPVQLKAVNDGWALYDKYWPEAQALDMRTKGYAPPKVDAIPYMVGDVAMTGGYSRLMYNKKDDLYKFRTDDDLKTMEDIVTGKGTVNQTNSGSTKARVGSGGKAPRLDFGVMDEHLGEVIHDIANREMVIQTYKLITNKRFMKIIDSKLGEAALGQFLPWVVRLAKGEPKPTSILERMVGKANNASSIMFLGLSLFNAIQNATGLPVAAALLGGKWVALGMAEFAKNPSAAVRFTMSKSGLIYVRRKTNQYSNDAKRALKTESFTGTGGDVARLAYAPQQIVQNMVDGAVWLGAYRKATAGKVQGVDPLNDAECVAFADRMIENTQSSGAIKDLSNLFARGEYMRMLTLMGSYFNMIFNMGRIRLGKRKYEPMTERYFNDAMFAIYIMVLPVLVTTMMRYEPPKEDEDLDDWATRTHFYKDLAAYPFASVVVLRSAASAYANPEFGFNAIPSLAWGEGIFKGTLAAGKLFDSESELERKDYKAMIEGVGYAFALPTKSVYKMGEPLYDYTEGNESGVDELRVLRSMILGKPRED